MEANIRGYKMLNYKAFHLQWGPYMLVIFGEFTTKKNNIRFYSAATHTPVIFLIIFLYHMKIWIFIADSTYTKSK